MPRKNVESFAGNAQYGDRNKGLVDWKMVFAGERERYAVQTALKGTPTPRKRVHEDEVDVEAMVHYPPPLSLCFFWFLMKPICGH